MTNPFEMMTNIMSNQCSNYDIEKIDNKLFESWKKQWLVDSLKEYNLGKSFCEFFNIGNATVLYHLKDNRMALDWIKKFYLK